MKWEIRSKFRVQSSEFRVNDFIALLLKNRGLSSKEDIETFLHPKLEDVTAASVGIDKKQLAKAIKRIEKSIENKEQVVVFGDYDVDGICGAAILWETLHNLGANVMPYIPHRVDEGYGLSIKGIENLRLHLPGVKLIITVDNGIVANEAVDFAKKTGIDVIITDHHLPHVDKKHDKPQAFAIVHTTKLCGAGVAWVLAQEIKKHYPVIASEAKPSTIRYLAKQSYKIATSSPKAIPRNDDEEKYDHLTLAALATIADMVPLTGSNRTIVKHGLNALRQTKRIGLLALFKEAGIDQNSLEVYQIGHVIAPRLNAAGRMESAMDSLRLLCTRDPKRAKDLAMMLGEINKLRQEETITATEHAIAEVRRAKSEVRKLLFVAHESYPQGVIGLVAGKLVERYYRPAIVIAIGETQSKASVRSVKGFNIIEFLRTKSDHFMSVGGHPMAAGFTIETVKIAALQKLLEESAEEILSDAHLTRSISIDCELPLEFINQELFEEIQRLSPFGIGNPEPVFASRAVIRDIRVMGREGKHLKLKLSNSSELRVHSSELLEAVGFGMGERAGEIKIGDEVEVAYILDENDWNGRKKLQLKMKDFR